MFPKEGGLWSSSVIRDSTARPLNRKLSIWQGKSYNFHSSVASRIFIAIVPTVLCVGGHRMYSNSKTLILKDSSIRSIWTYLTANPCHTTNTTIPQTNISMIKPLINAVSQFLQMCRNISEREFLQGTEAVAVGLAFRIYIMVWQWNLRNMLHLSLHLCYIIYDNVSKNQKSQDPLWCAWQTNKKA